MANQSPSSGNVTVIVRLYSRVEHFVAHVIIYV